MSDQVENILAIFVFSCTSLFLFILGLSTFYNIRKQLQEKHEIDAAEKEARELEEKFGKKEAIKLTMKRHWDLCDQYDYINPSVNWNHWQKINLELIRVRKIIEILTSNKIAMINVEKNFDK